MKLTKIYIILFSILFTTYSCNKDEVIEKTKPYVYTQQIYYATAVVNKKDLLTRQEEIQNIIDSGNSTSILIAEQEQNNLQIEKLSNLTEYLLGLNPSIGPIRPIPMPPDGCFDTANCIAILNLTNIDGIVLHNDIKATYITLFDDELGDIVHSFVPGDQFDEQDMFLPGDAFNNQEVWLLNSAIFTTNISKMYTTVSIDGLEDVLLETPIVIE